LREVWQLFETVLIDYRFSDSLLDRAKEALILKNLESMQKAQHLEATAERLESKTQVLEEKSRRDGLTGVFNRAYLDERVEQEFTMASERDWPMIILFVDLDHFKHVNDTYGHQVGDQVLQAVAKTLVNGTREEDIVARYGGEEFLVIAPGQGIDTARIMAERLVGMFQELKHVIGNGKEIVVTTSIGLSVLGAEDEFNSAGEMIAAADKALYIAKESGRNRYVIYGSDREQNTVGASSPAA